MIDSRRATHVATGIPATDLTMLLVVLIWGANFSVIKLTIGELPPLAFTAIRFTVGGLALLLILRALEGNVAFPAGAGWRLWLLGIIGNTIYQICFVLGLKITTAANGALLIATTPAIVALLGAALGVERLTRNVLGGIGLAFAGVALVLSARGLALSAATVWGDLLVLVAAFCWSIYTLGVRSLGAQLSPLRITTLTTLTGVPGLILVALPELISLDMSNVGIIGWGGLLYSTLLALVLAYILWNQSVRRVGSNRTAIYGCVIPLVATLVAWPALGERPVPLQAIGAACIIAGVLLTRRAPK